MRLQGRQTASVLFFANRSPDGVFAWSSVQRLSYGSSSIVRVVYFDLTLRKSLLQLHARFQRLDINSIYRANLSVDFDDIGFRNSGGLSIGFHERPPETPGYKQFDWPA